MISTINNVLSSIKTAATSFYKNPKAVPCKIKNLAASTFAQITSSVKNNPKKTIFFGLVAAAAYTKRAEITKLAKKSFNCIKNSQFVQACKGFFSKPTASSEDGIN
ncbi:MAG: hypothetical protein QRY72_00435 [Candidatus Rhabdochlamydia sp.]